MQGLKYFLVVVAAVAGLSVATRLVYVRHPEFKEPVAAPAVPAAPLATQPAKPVETRPATVTRAGTTMPPRPAARRSPRRTTAATRPAPNAQVTTDSARGFVALTPVPVPHIVLPPLEPAWQATPRQLVRDSAYVMARSGRLQAAIAVLDSWIRVNPADSAIALDLARLRARAGDWEGSIAQYSALIEQNRTAELLYERGQTYLWSGDTRRGEADLLESERMKPRVDTERQLADHYRWQGNFAKSASWYRQALRSEPGDTAAQNGMHLLDRAIEARLLMPGELAGGDFGSGMQATSDNAGFGFYALRLSQGLSMGSSSVFTLSGELRSATSMGTTGENQVDAYGVDAAVSRRLGASKFTATLGMLDHGTDSRMVRGAVTADGFMGNMRLRASLRRTPAYEPLWAPRLLGATGSPATALQAQGNVSLPLGGAAELYIMGEHLAVSDDNTRVAASLALRQRLPSSFSLVYSGSVMSYDQQTSLYYSPARYLSHSLGLEFARYREQGFSYSVRAMPGYAWMREPSGTADSTTRDLSAFQFASGLEVGYRRGAWDLLLSSGLSAGREGGYRSQNALLYLRRSW